jgi:hypothetical protein
LRADDVQLEAGLLGDLGEVRDLADPVPVLRSALDHSLWLLTTMRIFFRLVTA